MKTNKFFFILAILTGLFCLAIALDISPLLRGPAPYPPEWQWSYFFVNTLAKMYAPLSVLFVLLGIFWLVERKNFLAKKTTLLLVLLIVMSFLFQMSLLFFSRSGIGVLLHRIINPDLNSYFSASLSIHNVLDFLKNYQQEMNHFVYHARSHPPGAILIFYAIKQLITPFTFLIEYAKHINPTHLDVRQVWNLLPPIDKATALVSAFFLPFLTTLSLIPLFLSSKLLYGEKIAKRSLFLFVLLPTIVFFIPINDAFLPLFSITSFYFLLQGLYGKKLLSFFLSGFILFLGVFFNLALFPLIIFLFLFAVLFIKQKKESLTKYLKKGVLFTVGFFLPPLLLFLFLHFNSLLLMQTIMAEVPHVHSRSYTAWLFYNLYDFFVFAGLPLALTFFRQIKAWQKNDLLFIAFFITLLIIDLSGSTRGETGRIWAPYTPFLLLPAVAFLTNKQKFSTKLFIGLLILQSIQILVMQEFWVMLW